MNSEEMRRVRLGMATVMREPSAKKRAHLLDVAVTLGVGKFDTAPIYGLGTADRDLAALVKRCPGAAHITTKFGRGLSRQARVIAPVQAPLRVVLRKSASLRRVARSGQGGVKIPPAPAFTEVRDQALRACEIFNKPTLDEFITHEIPFDASWENLVHEIIRRAEEIPVERLGVSGGWDLLQAYPLNIRESVEVIQTPLADGPRGNQTQQTVLFGALSELSSRVSGETYVAARIKRLVDDSRTTTGSYPLLLAICLRAFPKADVVIGTSSADHLKKLLLDARTWLQRDDLDWKFLTSIAGTGYRKENHLE